MKNWIKDNDSNIILRSKVVLSRNISNVPFPNKLDCLTAREKSKDICDNILNDMNEENFKVYELWNSNKELYNEYIFKSLVCKDIITKSDRTAFMVNDEETISITLNRKNHIEIQCISAGLCLDEILSESMNIDNKIEEHTCYAYDDELGYLTVTLDNVGTGLNASIIMHLPAIAMSEEIEPISSKLKEKGIIITSLYKDNNKDYGNIYEITNKSTIGYSENDIIDNLNKAALEIVKQENELRLVLFNKCKDEIEDKVYRSYAILKSARLLDLKETIELLSNVRLGCELSFIDLEKGKINKLMESISEDYLKNYYNNQLEYKSIKYNRAEIVRNILV